MANLAPLYDLEKTNAFEDASTTKYERYEVKTNTAEFGLGQTTNFEIKNNDTDGYYDIGDTQLWLQYQLLNNTSACTNLEQVHLSNPWMLFDRVTLLLNGVQIASISDPGIVHTMRMLVEGGKSYSDSVQQKSHFFPLSKYEDADLGSKVLGTAASGDATYPTNSWSDRNQFVVATNEITNIIENPNYDENFAKQNALSTNVNNYCLLNLGELIPYLAQYNRVSRGQVFELKLTRSSPAKALFAGIAAPDFHIKKLSLFMRRVKPSLSKQVVLNSTLSSKAVVPLVYDHVDVHVEHDINKSTLANRFIIAHRSARVKQILVAFCEARNSESVRRDPLAFRRNKVNSIECRINGISFPDQIYRYTDEGSSRIIADIHELGMKNQVWDGDSLIDPVNWETTRCVYAFDTSRQEESFDSARNVQTELRYTLESAADNNYNVYCIVVSERKASLNLVDGHTKIYMD